MIFWTKKTCKNVPRPQNRFYGPWNMNILEIRFQNLKNVYINIQGAARKARHRVFFQIGLNWLENCLLNCLLHCLLHCLLNCLLHCPVACPLNCLLLNCLLSCLVACLLNCLLDCLSNCLFKCLLNSNALRTPFGRHFRTLWTPFGCLLDAF